MSTPWYKVIRSRLLLLILILGFVGPSVYQSVQKSAADAHKHRIINYACKVIEPRLQIGAFREVQDFLISTVGMFGELSPTIKLQEEGSVFESGPKIPNAEKFFCPFSGRDGVTVSFAFAPYSISGQEFFLTFGLTSLLFLLLFIAFQRGLKSAQWFAADLFHTWLARDLKLETLGLENSVRGIASDSWLKWFDLRSDLTKKIDKHIDDLQNAIKVQADELAERRADSAVAKMAEQIAHDIRSPLSAINIAISSLPSIPDENRKLVADAAARINGIAYELLARRRSESVATNLSAPSSCEIKHLKSVIREKQLEYSQRPELKIIDHLRSEEQCKIKLDAGVASRILSNLINNSAEAIEGPGIIRIQMKLEEGMLHLSVGDNGKGVPDEMLSHLGQRGFTLKTEVGGHFGSGLGLSHAKEIMEDIGGKLEVRSEIRKGTTVTLWIPLVET